MTNDDLEPADDLGSELDAAPATVGESTTQLGATERLEPEPAAPAPVFPRVPGVRLEAQIGRGGFATVYRGHQLSVDRDVAVKVDDRKLADARDRRRFTREIIAAGAVSGHPHIVTLYDGGTTSDDQPYLVMELYPGGSYSERIKLIGPIPAGEVLDVGFAIADALVAAHEEGILHRDVKPGNILISRYGSPALTDFGLAALPPVGDSYSVTMDSLTPSYAAPEAFGGLEPTLEMDIYALGATLYAMLLGRPPRSDETGAAPPLTKLLLLLNEPLPPAPVPGAAELMPVIWRATALDPEDRYRSAAEFRDDLAAVRAGHPDRVHGLRPFTTVTGATDSDPSRTRAGEATQASTLESPSGSVPVITPERRPAAVWWAIGAAVVALLALGAGLMVRQGSVAGVASAGSGGSVSVVSSPSATSQSPSTSSTASLITTPPAVGDCFGEFVAFGGRGSASRIACEEEHVWEAFAIGELDPQTTSVDRKTLAADPNVEATCLSEAILTEFVGRKDDFIIYSTVALGPEQDAFNDGERTFWCLAKRADAGSVTGSMRDGN